MKLILVSRRHDGNRTLDVGSKTLSLFAVGALVLTSALFGAGVWLGSALNQTELDNAVLAKMAQHWQQETKAQQQEVSDAVARSEAEMAAMALRVAQLQARLIRMEAVGERLTQVAKMDRGEFDFSTPPAVGGPAEGVAAEALGQAEITQELAQLTLQLEDREQQLAILSDVLNNRTVSDEGYLAGRPIKKGWMSSAFGRRVDPFHGKLAWHKGVDFAGKEDAEIIAVASGVITWSGERYGYGLMVEINHGNGYVTRYAHNKENLVSLGQVVNKGQVIARMGSSGRSTGPHVHYEVYKNGVAVNPARYIYRKHRG